MDKNLVRQALLSLESHHLQDARKTYREYLASARLDKSEPIENDEQAQAELASDMAEAFDDPIQDYSENVAKLNAIDFGPKTKVEEGAIVKFGGRYFVIAVSTPVFSCDGQQLMGISTRTPVFTEIEDAKVGDEFTINGKRLLIEDVM